MDSGFRNSAVNFKKMNLLIHCLLRLQNNYGQFAIYWICGWEADHVRKSDPDDRDRKSP